MSYTNSSLALPGSSEKLSTYKNSDAEQVQAIAPVNTHNTTLATLNSTGDSVIVGVQNAQSAGVLARGSDLDMVLDFDVSHDKTHWFNVRAVRLDTPNAESYNRHHLIGSAAFGVTAAHANWLRVKVASRVSGVAYLSILPSHLGIGVEQEMPIRSNNGRIHKSNRLPVASYPATAWAVVESPEAGKNCQLIIPVAAGKYHYLTGLTISKYNVTNRAAGLSPIKITSGNIKGNPFIHFPTARVGGTIDERKLEFTAPLRTETAGMPFAIYCPATAGVIWSISATYFTKDAI